MTSTFKVSDMRIWVARDKYGRNLNFFNALIVIWVDTYLVAFGSVGVLACISWFEFVLASDVWPSPDLTVQKMW